MRALLLSVQRSGTKMLCSALASHPQIACEHEYFRKLRHADPLPSVEQALNKLAYHAAKPCAVGHAQFEDLSAGMLQRNIPVLLLERKALDVAMSALTQNGNLEPAPARIARQLATVKLQQALLRPWADLIVTYEALLDGLEEMHEVPQTIARRLCKFLGVPHHRLHTAERLDVLEHG